MRRPQPDPVLPQQLLQEVGLQPFLEQAEAGTGADVAAHHLELTAKVQEEGAVGDGGNTSNDAGMEFLFRIARGTGLDSPA